MKIKLLPGILFFLLIWSNLAYSQKQMFGGLHLTVETIEKGEFVVGGGASFETSFTNHSGLETGLFYRRYIINGISYDLDFTIKERLVSIPVLYKFSSAILNVSAGPTFDILLAFKQFGGRIYNPPTSYEPDPSIGIGGMIKLSKRIILSDGFVLEPELRYNHIFSTSRNYAGVGVAAKFNLN